MELTELMRGAQEAMDRGDYQVATRACTHVLEAYPSCLTAHRVLGEAHLERGEADLATQHFDSVLEIDPLNVVARLGLGVAAEERADPTTAYTHYLNAWEINPALEQVREELVRLRIALGREDRLHPTRAGLASIFARGGQLGRAAAEWRALLHADPENVRSRSALAEVLWRAGDDAGAAAAAKSALDSAPYNARLLAMLADIERRHGANDVGALVERYHDADPLGDVIAGLADLRPSVELDFLQPGPKAIAPLELQATPVSAPEPQHFAPGALAVSHLPAPDLWDNLVQDFGTDPMGMSMGSEPVGDIVPFAWEDALGTNDQAQDDSILGDAVSPVPAAVAPEPLMVAPEPVMAAPAEETHNDDDLNQYFAAPQGQMPAAPEPLRSDPLPQPDADFAALMAEPTVPAPIAAAFPTDDLAALMAAPADSPASAYVDSAFTTVLPEMTADDLVLSNGFAPPTEATAIVAEAPNPFITADGRVDLTVGWDDLDRTLAEATPHGDFTREYEHLLAEIDAGGIAPFATVEPAGDTEAWEPLSAEDVQPMAAAPAPDAGADLQDLDLQLDETWGSEPAAEAAAIGSDDLLSSFPDESVIVPAEVAASIQEPEPTGYTEIFRNIDQDTLLLPEEESPVNPLARPDLAGEPPDLADVLSVAADDALDFSSQFDNIDLSGLDGVTADDWLAGIESDAVVAEPVAAAVSSHAAGQDTFDPLLSDLHGIEPFSFDEGGANGVDGEFGVDFSEVNEAPFDPSQYSAMPDLAALHDTTRPAISPDPIAEDEPLELIDDELAFDFAAVETAPALDVAAEAQSASDDQDEDFPALDVRSWPAFVGVTSELIDRGQGGLFARLRAEKVALVEAGIVTLAPRAELAEVASAAPVDWTPPAVATAPVEEAPPEEIVASKAPVLSVVATNAMPDHGLDLIALRDRLLESDASALEVAELLEAAVSRGTSDPALWRALGEAYLKVGKSEQAAAQFRRAMLARRRAQ